MDTDIDRFEGRKSEKHLLVIDFVRSDRSSRCPPMQQMK